MQFLRQFLSFLTSRQTVAVVGIGLLMAAVWWIGPELALNGLHPLASIGVRLSVLLLLLALAVVWLASWPLGLVGIASSCLLLWHGGPLISIGDAQPLAAVSTRVWLICAVVLVYTLYWLRRAWLTLNDGADPVAKLLSLGQLAAGRDAATEEMKTVATSVQRALAQLKGMRSQGGFLRRLVEGKRYLYELPWYMVIGSPGAGKTTAVRNSGLRFPLAGPSTRGVALGAHGGTMHCDWWLSNEAVLIDTAGRYATHDSNPANDPAEWHGFLGLLRKHRPRAPINGALVALNAADLLTMSTSQRSAHARMLRERLVELRQELGIDFPVYVMVTKMDLLRGFGEYFQSLTAEGRAQPWGFTFASLQTLDRRDSFSNQVTQELGLLKERLAVGLRARLNEEYDLGRRRRLFALPQEFAGLALPLVQVLEEIFLDSRFDTTQWHSALRGVYFTSGAQSHAELPADEDTLLQRLRRSFRAGDAVASVATGVPANNIIALENSRQLAPAASAMPIHVARADDASIPPHAGCPVDTSPTQGHQGFFLQDLLAKVIFPEAHLVRPNLRWELRFRLLRLAGHALTLVAFLWLAAGLAVSYRANRDYLDGTAERTQALALRVKEMAANDQAEDVPEVLTGAQNLPLAPTFDLQHPPAAMRFGLSVLRPISEAAARTYESLQARLLLPSILARMETVLAESVRRGDASTAYDTLRAYKLLHDPQHYMKDNGARDVRDWVIGDWERTDSVDVFRGRASMVDQVKSLFSGDRPVVSAALPNEALVRRVQAFLGTSTPPQRIYERAKAAMQPEAPADFTLARALGPQGSSLFVRTGDPTQPKGVPGLFTYDGYHQLFDKRLPEFVGRALEEDAWVMGRGATGIDARAGTRPPGDGQALRSPESDSVMLREVRRLYLTDYASQWEAFTASIRAVGGTDTPGGRGGGASGLGLELSVLRQFATPESPLLRLARAIARETTLSRPLETAGQGADKGLLAQAAARVDSRAVALGQGIDKLSGKPLAREIVDDRFIALREVVTGHPDPMSDAAAVGARPGLEAVSGLINEFYNALVVADTALAAGSPPPGGADVGARLRLEASKLPAPLRDVLIGLAGSGGAKVMQGSTDILRKQAQAQLDRINGLLAQQVSEPCKRGIEGRYPLAAVPQEVSMEDFSLFFGPGGAVDDYFNKNLAPLVDTSVRPWRYKSPAMLGALGGVDSLVAAASGSQASELAPPGPSVLGELLKMLPASGPPLDMFYRAAQIRKMFFPEGSGKKFALQTAVRVAEIDPAVTDLGIDIDGQVQRYAHGPVEPLAVAWPGPRGGSVAELTANPRVSASTSSIVATGPWAFFRLLDKGHRVGTTTPGRMNVEYSFDGRKALLAVDSGSQTHPFNTEVLRGFECPAHSD